MTGHRPFGSTPFGPLMRVISDYQRKTELGALSKASQLLRVREARTFATYLVEWLDQHDYEIRRRRSASVRVKLGHQPAAETLRKYVTHYEGHPLMQAARQMRAVDVADLLHVLDRRGLRWIDGELHEGPVEPADGYIVFDGQCDVWQRDDTAAALSERRWFVAGDSQPITWADLRSRGPIAPDGGIAPTSNGEAT